MAEGNGSNASLSERVERYAENSYLKLVGRGAMIAASLVALPVGGWLGSRALDQIDAHAIAIATLQAEISATERAIIALSAGRYTANDANRDFAIINEKDAEQDRRLGAHDQQIERLTQNQRYAFPH